MEKISCAFEDVYLNPSIIWLVERGGKKKATWCVGYEEYPREVYTLIINNSRTLLFNTIPQLEKAEDKLINK